MVFRYAHPEWFEGIEKPNLSPQDTILLWGAGKLGSVVAHAAGENRKILLWISYYLSPGIIYKVF